MRTRVIIPLVLPLITAAAILVYVLNLSRALLAGGKWGALAIASIVTVTILFGAALDLVAPAHANLDARDARLRAVPARARVGPDDDRAERGEGGGEHGVPCSRPVNPSTR